MKIVNLQYNICNLSFIYTYTVNTAAYNLLDVL